MFKPSGPEIPETVIQTKQNECSLKPLDVLREKLVPQDTGSGHMVHQLLPPSEVKITTRRECHTVHIISTPRFLPDTFVPKTEVRIIR
jgi:hypothetical protein